MLEITYPNIPGVPMPTDLGSFLLYAYAFSLIVSVGVCFLMLLYGGFLRLISTNNPGKAIMAKDQVNSAFTGLAILLLSFMMLKIINPDLLAIRLPGLNSPPPAPIVPPLTTPDLTKSYWELPIGAIQEIVFKKMGEIRPLAKAVKDKTAVLETKAIDFKEALEECSCSPLAPKCDAGADCHPLKCTKQSGLEAEYKDICQNWQEIDQKRKALEGAEKILKTSRQNLIKKQFELTKETLRLDAVKNLLSACLPMPFDRLSMLALQETNKVEIEKIWNEIDNKQDPNTFYCQIEEAELDSLVNGWFQNVAELWASLNYGSDPNTPPGPAPDPNPGALAWPVTDPVVGQPFGEYTQETGGGWHGGIDLNFGNFGEIVYAAADGTVSVVDYVWLGGGDRENAQYIAIDHKDINGKPYRSIYLHLSEFLVTSGEVRQGDPIGKIGSTASYYDHLHFEVRDGDALINPCLFLPPGADGIGCPLEPAMSEFPPGEYY